LALFQSIEINFLPIDFISSIKLVSFKEKVQRLMILIKCWKQQSIKQDHALSIR